MWLKMLLGFWNVGRIRFTRRRIAMRRLADYIRAFLDRHWPDEKRRQLRKELYEAMDTIRMQREVIQDRKDMQGCERHSALDYGDFLDQGGGDCPVCLQNECDVLRASIREWERTGG